MAAAPDPTDHRPDRAEVPPPAGAILSLPLIGTAITPLTLALTGMLYLTGWTERNRLLKEFGVSASVVPEPIQNTLARGYFPLLAGIATSVVILGTLLFLLNSSFKRLESSRAGESSFFPVGSTLAEFMRRAKVRAAIASITVAGIFLALLISHLSGIVSAWIKEERARQAVAGACSKCFRYRVNGREIRARVLAQNDDRTILLRHGGILLIKTEDISVVFERPPD